jgi:ElaB/YqjD/DUF883 family membrane-anchored ribosome-binding protein
LKGLTGAIGELASKQASEGLDELKLKRDKIEAQLRQAAGEARTTIEGHVREKPVNSLLLAFAVGLLLGKGFGR